MRANRLVLAGAVIAGEVLFIPAGAVHAAKNAGKRRERSWPRISS